MNEKSPAAENFLVAYSLAKSILNIILILFIWPDIRIFCAISFFLELVLSQNSDFVMKQKVVGEV